MNFEPRNGAIVRERSEGKGIDERSGRNGDEDRNCEEVEDGNRDGDDNSDY